MAATVLITPDAQRQFNQLPRRMQARVLAIFERLRGWPEVSGAKALRGDLHGSFRIRSGDWRVVFRPNADGTIVIVWIIGHRGGVYD